MTVRAKAVLVFHPKYGDIWRGQCSRCVWTSKDLPFDTRSAAEHCVDLHAVLCKASDSKRSAAGT